jgi:hypothetical protein
MIIGRARPIVQGFKKMKTEKPLVNSEKIIG